MRYSAQSIKSVMVFSLRGPRPASCHWCPYFTAAAQATA